MLLLPNGCRCSPINVHPKNWNEKGAQLSPDWYIHYRFYDPVREKPKQVILKNMNRFKDLDQRRVLTKTLLEGEIDRLRKGYNPFHSTIETSDRPSMLINKNTPFITALLKAYENLDKAPSTRSDIASVIRGVARAATCLRIDDVQISCVTRMHLKQILAVCKTVVPGWSPNRFNKYRSYLKILFGELIEYEATEIDPLARIKKQKTVKKIRPILSQEERLLVSNHLKEKYPSFWRFIQIFFHSGARESELIMVRESDVDLKNQRFKITIKKGSGYNEVWKTIKDISLPFWTEILSEAKQGEYLFSRRLKPGAGPINAAQISRRWRAHVKSPKEKGGLGISADFYSLKHLHTTEVVEMLSIQDAAKHNSHSSTRMVTQVYDVRNHQRLDSLVKGLRNEL